MFFIYIHSVSSAVVMYYCNKTDLSLTQKKAISTCSICS